MLNETFYKNVTLEIELLLTTTFPIVRYCNVLLLYTSFTFHWALIAVRFIISSTHWSIYLGTGNVTRTCKRALKLSWNVQQLLPTPLPLPLSPDPCPSPSSLELIKGEMFLQVRTILIKITPIVFNIQCKCPVSNFPEFPVCQITWFCHRSDGVFHKLCKPTESVV